MCVGPKRNETKKKISRIKITWLIHHKDNCCFHFFLPAQSVVKWPPFANIILCAALNERNRAINMSWEKKPLDILSAAIYSLKKKQLTIVFRDRIESVAAEYKALFR